MLRCNLFSGKILQKLFKISSTKYEFSGKILSDREFSFILINYYCGHEYFTIGRIETNFDLYLEKPVSAFWTLNINSDISFNGMYAYREPGLY